MSKSARIQRGSQGTRKKNGYPAKAGRRHIVNVNHPYARDAKEQASMRKEVR